MRSAFVVLALLTSVAVWYWYDWRPASIRRMCSLSATNEAMGGLPGFIDSRNLNPAMPLATQPIYKFSYERCLHYEGLVR